MVIDFLVVTHMVSPIGIRID